MLSGWNVLALCWLVKGLDDSLSQLPALGYNTWNDLRCDGVTAEAIRNLTDKMVDEGLVSLGYQYLNIDDCWASGLNHEGKLIPDPKHFPEGMKPVVEYVHSKGLKFGIYACRGLKTCAFRPGSHGLENIHAAQFTDWGVDYLKYDGCYATNLDRAGAITAYSTMRDALNSTGRKILYSLCGWNHWYAPYGGGLAHSWRIAPDIDEWANAYVAVRTNEALAKFAGPGLGFNDPDMLGSSSPSAHSRLTVAQVQTQFSLWAVMAAPLLLGRLHSEDLHIFKNSEIIAIDQDPLGIQGEVVWSNCPPFKPHDNWWMSPWSMPREVAKGWFGIFITLTAGSFLAYAKLFRGKKGLAVFGTLTATLALVIFLSRPSIDACQQIWAKPLHDGDFAICLVNFSPLSQWNFDFELASLYSKYPLQSSSKSIKKFAVRDVVGHRDVGKLERLQMDVLEDGHSLLFRVKPE
mmetsp:Transcript_4529/g.5244  ORF Transcript_4529/g.5244 Transcript_4529/m.5244 type:complete len:462 (+) Transcript_4529:71-1456(+)